MSWYALDSATWLHLVCFGCGTYGHDLEHCSLKHIKNTDTKMANIDMPDDIDSETARWVEEMQAEEVLEKKKKEDMDKFESLNKWNLVTPRRQAHKQIRNVPLGNSYRGISGDRYPSYGKYSDGARSVGHQDKGKAVALPQNFSKPRFINSERLTLGNNNIQPNKRMNPSHRRVLTQASPASSPHPHQAPYKKYTPASQTHTINGVQVHAFNQPVIYVENKDKSTRPNDVNTSEEESKQASNEPT